MSQALVHVPPPSQALVRLPPPPPRPRRPAGFIPDIGSSAPDALGLGRFFDTTMRSYGGRIRYGDERHVLVFGPNGSGKGTRLLVPNLLQCEDRSIFVIDPKGELAAITAPFRRKLGKVVVLNPFGVLTGTRGYGDLKSDGYNPLVPLNPASPSFNTDAGLLAEALVKVQGRADPHWSESSRALIAALIMYTVIEARAAGKVPNLLRVRELVCLASEAPAAANDFTGVGIPALALQMMESGIAGLRNKAAQFTDWTREVQSIASDARRQTEFLDDVEIAADLSKDGFDFRDMKREPVTVYLILPPQQMMRHAKWLRLVVTAALQGVMRERKPGEPRALFMLDEFAALGHLEIISTTWALVRGYGIQIMPVLQSLPQLQSPDLYGNEWETFIGMAGAVVNFTPNDMTTAEWISRRAGTATAIAASQNAGSSMNPHGHHSQSQGMSYSNVSVPALRPHKLLGMQRGFGVTFFAELAHHVPCYIPAYYEIEQCRERARANPYYLGQ
jgi:type IV secretion system protein VirD4